MESDVRQGLCQAVCNHLLGWIVGELDPFRSHSVTDVVVLEVDVFCPRMKDRVVGESYGALVVTLQWNGNAWWRFSPPSPQALSRSW